MKRLRCLFALALALISSAALPRHASAQVPTGGMREVWSIEADSTLVAPRSIVVTGGCTVWFTDTRTGLWRVPCYGGPRQRIGTLGDSAGAYRMPWTVSFIGRDSVALWDRQLLRVSEFGPNGEFLLAASLRIPEVVAGRVLGLSRDSAGRYVAWTSKIPLTGEDNNERGYVLAFTAAGAVRDTLAAFPGVESITYGRGGSAAPLTGRFDGPLARRPFVVFRRNGSFVIASNDRPYLDVYDGAGSRQVRVRLPFGAPSIATAADRDAYTDSIKRAVERDMGASAYDDSLRARIRTAVAGALTNGMTWPSHRRYFDQLALDERQDAAWILLSGAGPGYTRTWLVCALQTESVCRSLSVPHRGAVIAVAIHAGAVYAVEQSADGVPRIVKYASQ